VFKSPEAICLVLARLSLFILELQMNADVFNGPLMLSDSKDPLGGIIVCNGDALLKGVHAKWVQGKGTP
jgi:hypothetical protein